MEVSATKATVRARQLSSGLELNGRRLAQILLSLSLLSGVAQLAMGASPLVVVLALIGIAVGLYGFLVLGAFNIASWVAFLYLFGNVLIALYAKTLLWQPLDSFLYAPQDSFFAEAVTLSGLVLALLLANRLRVGEPFLPLTSDPAFLRFLSWSTFALAVGFTILNHYFRDPYEGSGFGGVAIFRDFFIIAVIARTAMLLEESQDRGSFDGWLGVIMATGVIVGLIDNGKTATALPVLGYYATVLFYRQSIGWKPFVFLLIGGIFFMTFVGPMIHAYRALGQEGLSLMERIEFIGSNTERLLERPGELRTIEKLASGAFRRGYYDYFGGDGTGQMILGRYAMIQAIDPVVYEVNRHGVRGGEAIGAAITRHIPKFLYPDKPEFGESYHTLVYFRLVHPEGGKYPTLPLAGQAYAAYGMTGIVFIPFLTFLLFFLVLKKLGWSLYRNVYAIFFFVNFVVVFVNQGDVGQYSGAALRYFPLFAAWFWLISYTYRYRVRFDI